MRDDKVLNGSVRMGAQKDLLSVYIVQVEEEGQHTCTSKRRMEKQQLYNTNFFFEYLETLRALVL